MGKKAAPYSPENTLLLITFIFNIFGRCCVPAALLVGVQATDEVDELLGDELLGHDQLQLVKIGPLLL